MASSSLVPSELRASLALTLSLSSAVAGCNLISGIDEFQFAGGGAGAGGAAQGAGGAGASTTSGGGGAGASGGAGGAGGAGGSSSCTEPLEQCGQSCVDTTADPQRCGDCTHECDSDERCVASDCVCRPGLVVEKGACVDPNANPEACGGGASCEAPTPLCQNGDCVAACSPGRDECDGGCFDLDTSPLHCGTCARACEVDKICSGGDCFEFSPGTSCDSCPCDTCGGDFSLCCEVGGQVVCLSHDAEECP